MAATTTVTTVSTPSTATQRPIIQATINGARRMASFVGVALSTAGRIWEDIVDSAQLGPVVDRDASRHFGGRI